MINEKPGNILGFFNSGISNLTGRQISIKEGRDDHQFSIVIGECIEHLGSKDPEKRDYYSRLLANFILNSGQEVESGERMADLLSPAFIEQKSGLHNWHIFKLIVEHYIKTPEAGAAIILSYDLLDFGLLNNAKGQEVGDLFIAEFGNALHRVVRSRDDKRHPDVATNIKDPEQQRYPSRIGGDEFAVILTGIEDESAVDLDALSWGKIHRLLKDEGLRRLIKEHDVDGFGIRVGATWVDRDLTYSENMDNAHPKNEEKENKNMRAKAKIVKTGGSYKIVDCDLGQ